EAARLAAILGRSLDPELLRVGELLHGSDELLLVAELLLDDRERRFHGVSLEVPEITRAEKGKRFLADVARVPQAVVQRVRRCPRSPDFGSLPRRPATSILAAFEPRFSIGSGRKRPAARSSSASRTPTASGARRRTRPSSFAT